ncbi:muconolactone Delta-isomerase family protein [Streptomyces iconiensis]|uniref:Muconolactone Delta-isomerase n=1 Tax=Streptomyces iconiensis TaxID=1384038 RepID=A0ABT6ZTZ7_9ACTN|nr:muconolactone Delta-isomerase family protein [Streptomyces iconiensis]MDJ1132528.1 muconolactone Delta-isomerase family protein [Streptomyces iconiensis]
MDFLVRIDTSRAYTLSAEDSKDLIERERVRGHQLMNEGVLRHFWRLPGKHANIGIWSVPDADALEETLNSLPVRPYAEIDVTPLATHPMTVEAMSPPS